MRFRANVNLLLCLAILTPWSMSFADSGSPAPIGVGNDLICEKVGDAREIVRSLKDYELLKEEDRLKEQRIANLEKEIELLKRESELKDKIIHIKEMEIIATRRALNDMKEVADRAIKLAEVGKPKSNWELQRLLGWWPLLSECW